MACHFFEKFEKKGLTNGGGSGILTKLSARYAARPTETLKKFKKLLTSARQCVTI